MEKELPSYIRYWLKDAKHDCFFIVGHENGTIERIGALKVFLMGHSEPFRAMLQDSRLAEKSDIRVTDVEPATFWNLLKCVYGASDFVIQKLTFEECAKLVYVTEKYLTLDIKRKVSKCFHSLFSHSFGNIFVALSHPICYQDEFLSVKILEILETDFNRIISHDKFLELSFDAVEWLVIQDHFRVREAEVWNAIVRWARHKTKSTDGEVLRSFVFHLLKHVRFLAMDCKEFCTKVVDTEILHDHEVFEICKAFSSGDAESFKLLFDNDDREYIPRTMSKKIACSLEGNPQHIAINCTVSDIEHLNCCNYENSECIQWAGYLWNVFFKKEESEEVCALGIFLKCCNLPWRAKPDWSCSVDVGFKILNQIGKRDASKSFTARFHDSTKGKGYDKFINWNKLLNPDNGFANDGKITVMVLIKELTQQQVEKTSVTA